jgi:hypothetical protein
MIWYVALAPTSLLRVLIYKCPLAQFRVLFHHTVPVRKGPFTVRRCYSGHVTTLDVRANQLFSLTAGRAVCSCRLSHGEFALRCVSSFWFSSYVSCLSSYLCGTGFSPSRMNLIWFVMANNAVDTFMIYCIVLFGEAINYTYLPHGRENTTGIG